MSPKRLNPESRVTPELLGDISGLQQEFSRIEKLETPTDMNCQILRLGSLRVYCMNM